MPSRHDSIEAVQQQQKKQKQQKQQQKQSEQHNKLYAPRQRGAGYLLYIKTGCRWWRFRTGPASEPVSASARSHWATTCGFA